MSILQIYFWDFVKWYMWIYMDIHRYIWLCFYNRQLIQFPKIYHLETKGYCCLERNNGIFLDLDLHLFCFHSGAIFWEKLVCLGLKQKVSNSIFRNGVLVLCWSDIWFFCVGREWWAPTPWLEFMELELLWILDLTAPICPPRGWIAAVIAWQQKTMQHWTGIGETYWLVWKAPSVENVRKHLHNYD